MNIEALHREVRRLRALTLAAVFTTLAILIAGASRSDVVDEFTARRLAIVDAAGHERIVMEVTKGTPEIELYHADGSQGLHIAILNDNSPAVILSDRNGKPRATYALTDGKAPTLSLNAADGFARVSLSLQDKDGGGVLRSYNNLGGISAKFP